MDFVEPLEAVIPGATGRVMGVLARSSMPLSARAIAELASVSPAQAARVLPRLAELGLAEQQHAPPSVLYTLARENVAAAPLVALSELDDMLVSRLAEGIAQLDGPPVAVAVYGSFARRQARADSDIDLVVVRPSGIGEEDDDWRSTVDDLVSIARRLSGNRVEVLDVAQHEVHELLASDRPLWQNIAREARVVFGGRLDEL